jgi:cytochrome c oxidase cbb3-type subunit III
MFSLCLKRSFGVGLMMAGSLCLSACQRDANPSTHPVKADESKTTTSALHAGGQSIDAPTPQNYTEDATALGEGKRLFAAYNCNGCHSGGGGGMGVPLTDKEWIYGESPAQIYDTLVKGRPNGMPSFRGKIPEAQMWQLIAYVRSLSITGPR